MPKTPPPKLPHLIRNPVSLAGALLAIGSAVFLLVLLLIDVIGHNTNPYTGILIYMVLPPVLVVALLIIPVGMWREWSRRRRRPGVSLPPLPVVDLNSSRMQVSAIVFVVGTALVIPLLTYTGYRAYHYTESVDFCGVVCHQVMRPEYTTYLRSPHARVPCTACHVGPGAGWFVRSKLSGAYQVYSVTFKKYERPIKTPVHSLRPAQATCEQCHWPAKFFGAQQRTFYRVLSDEANTPWQIDTLVKVGGGQTEQSPDIGIHGHMNVLREVEYIATDAQRQQIPWVRVTDPATGEATEYMSTEHALTPEEIAAAEVRRMDCVDCHNRPSHIFHSPTDALDRAFATGQLDRGLPYLKREATRVLTADYPSQEAAARDIRRGLAAFYQATYPQVFQAKGVAVHEAAEAIVEIYRTNVFPSMRTDWRAHPNHLGHKTALGCFRCHDGQHVSRDGRVVTRNCNACHTIVAQGDPETLKGQPLQAQAFRHPVDVGMDVTEFACSTCHTGAGGL